MTTAKSRTKRAVLRLTTGLVAPSLALAMLASPGQAQDVGSRTDADVDFLGEGPILMLADTVRVEAAEEVVIAEGDVDITRETRRLLADSVRYYRNEDRIEAVGNVTLLEPSGEAFYADAVTLSGDLKDGVIEQLKARIGGNGRMAATEATRIDGRRTEMDQAVYSPCPSCAESDRAPLWQITADKVVHDQDAREVVYSHAFFELFGVPIFYTPRFSHPDPSVDRKSGFIAPSIGQDTELGFVLETPYYFALGPNYDATLTPIITSKEGTVFAGEYRHRLRSGDFNTTGSITRGSEAENDSDDQSEGDDFRGHLESDGRFILGGGWDGGYDLFVASDDTYLERYDFSNEDILENRAFAEKIDERNYIGVNAYGFQGLREEDEQGEIPVVLPQLETEFESDPMALGSRLFLDSSVLVLTRTDGLDTRRLSSTTGWKLPWVGKLGDQYELKLSARGDLYDIDGDPETLSADGKSTEARFIPRATLDWSWPWIGNTFGLTPVIEPIASLTLAPTGLNDDDIPNEDSIDLEFDDTNLFEESRFPGLDQVEEGSRISYGTRFGAIGNEGEKFNALIGQSLNFQKTDQFDADTGLDGRFSDYVGRLEFTPVSWAAGRYRFRLDEKTFAPVRNEVQTAVGPPWFRFDLSYLSLEDDPSVAEEEFREREEITAGLQLGLGESLVLRAQTRKDLQSDSTIANTYGFVYRHPCLLLIGGVEQAFTEDRDVLDGTRVSLRITFESLGEVGGETSLAPF